MLRKLISYFAKNNGGVGVMAGMLAFPMVGAVGMGVEVSLVMSSKHQLQQRVDSAAVSVISVDSPVYLAAEAGETLANLRKMVQTELNGVVRAVYQDSAQINTIVTTFDNQNDRLTLEVTATGSIDTTVSSVLGVTSIPFTVTSLSIADLRGEYHLHFIVDISHSMLLGATQADRDTMFNAPAVACEFACHKDGADTYTATRSLNVNLRLDVVKQVIANFASAPPNPSLDYVYSIYTMNASLQSVTLNSSGTVAAAAAMTIEPPTWGVTWWNRFNQAAMSNQDKVLREFNQIYGPSLNGPNSGVRREDVVIVMTDGLIDRVGNHPPGPYRFQEGGRTFDIMDDSGVCAEIKARGLRLGVINVNYPFQPKNRNGKYFHSHILSWWVQIPDQLRACASPGLYTEGLHADDIRNAVENMFRRITAKPSTVS